MDLGTVTFIANSFLILGVFLLLRLANTGHASCISRKSQELYLAAFTTRYLNVFRDVFEVFTAPLSYVLVIKLLLLGSTSWIIWVLRRGGVSHGADNRSCLYLLIPSVAVGVVVQYVKTQLFRGPLNTGFALNMDLLFIVSMFIEMAAVVPQLELFRSKTIRAEDQQEGSSYDILPPIASFATYRILFVVKWLIMARTGYEQLYVKAACGVVQVLLYVPFFKIWCESHLCPTERTIEKDEKEDQLEDPLIRVV